MKKRYMPNTNWYINKLEIAHGNHSPLKPMEGLRGLAVFLVFLVHYCSLFEPYIMTDTISAQFLYILKNVGNIGVDLFFVLSGFLIYGTLLKKTKTLFIPYFKRRLVRIYPTFLVVFTIYLILSFLIPAESKLPDSGLDKFIFIIQNLLLLPGIFEVKAIITVAWSLSFEVFYYISIPIVLGLLKMRAWRFQNRVTFWLSVSVVGFLLFEIFGDPADYTRLLMFISGILLYEVYTQKSFKLPNFFGTLSLIFSMLFYHFSSEIPSIPTLSVIILFVCFFFLCLEAFASNNGSALWLSFSPLRWLGNMSYSYYLIHGITLKALFLFMTMIIPAAEQFDYQFWLILPIFFIITLISSFILYITIEKPLSIDKK
ncbi:acyltransferase family protein [Cognaticolwellia mytili]|uniref:acyltransferase family protein n=1 Tax=Cognaticolwellia mytili TaxID=1888913 RepID=UPI000A16E94B|nr:acyltransferase [Cognaticolwellia mytili]